MTQITFDLPDEVFSALRRSPKEFAEEMRIAAAIRWYQQGMVSQEKAAGIAGMGRAQFLERLAAEKVDVFQVDFKDLAEEIAP